MNITLKPMNKKGSVFGVYSAAMSPTLNEECARIIYRSNLPSQKASTLFIRDSISSFPCLWYFSFGLKNIFELLNSLFGSLSPPDSFVNGKHITQYCYQQVCQFKNNENISPITNLKS